MRRLVALVSLLLAAWVAATLATTGPRVSPMAAVGRGASTRASEAPPMQVVDRGAVVSVEPARRALEPTIDRSPRPATEHTRHASIRGSLAGLGAPGFGDAWIVEAYRLTATHSAVAERRRAYVSPRGDYALDGLAPGSWQLALVAPRFLWGELVEVLAGQPSAHVVLPSQRPTGSVLIDLLPANEPRTARIELAALRSPELAATPLRVLAGIASQELTSGATWRIESVPPGVYEVVVTRLGDPADPYVARELLLSRREVIVGHSVVRVEIGLAPSGS